MSRLSPPIPLNVSVNNYDVQAFHRGLMSCCSNAEPKLCIVVNEILFSSNDYFEFTHAADVMCCYALPDSYDDDG